MSLRPPLKMLVRVPIWGQTQSLQTSRSEAPSGVCQGHEFRSRGLPSRDPIRSQSPLLPLPSPGEWDFSLGHWGVDNGQP